MATQYLAEVDKPVIRDLILGEGGALPLADDLATERAFAHRLLLEQCLDLCGAKVAASETPRDLGDEVERSPFRNVLAHREPPVLPQITNTTVVSSELS